LSWRGSAAFSVYVWVWHLSGVVLDSKTHDLIVRGFKELPVLGFEVRYHPHWGSIVYSREIKVSNLIQLFFISLIEIIIFKALLDSFFIKENPFIFEKLSSDPFD